MAKFWDWIYRITHSRTIREDIAEMDAMDAEIRRENARLDKRIAESFTPEEWEALRIRCEARLARMDSSNG